MKTLSKTTRRATWLAAPLALLTVLGSSCRPAEAAARPPPPPTVEVVEVVQRDVPVGAEWVATLDGVVNAKIQPQVTGYLVKQDYREGSFVKKGDVLFEIDPRTFEAALAQARGQRAQSEAQLAKATRDVSRDTPLAAAHAVAQSQLDDDLATRRADAAALESATAAVRTAQLNLDFTKVRALTDGIAGIAQAQLGNLVGPTTQLTTVARVDPIKANVSISEREYLQFVRDADGKQAGRPFPDGDIPLQLVLVDGSTFPYPGKFVAADDQVDSATGTLRVAAEFPNPESVLRPGQFARVRATLATRRGALLVPQRAVNEMQGAYQVAVVGPDDKVAVRTVRVGARVGAMWLIEDGVSAGEKVVAEGFQKVRDGAKVATVAFQQPVKG